MRSPHRPVRPLFLVSGVTCIVAGLIGAVTLVLFFRDGTENFLLGCLMTIPTVHIAGAIGMMRRSRAAAAVTLIVTFGATQICALVTFLMPRPPWLGLYLWPFNLYVAMGVILIVLLVISLVRDRPPNGSASPQP
jgi:hypothetical protein